MFTVLFWKKIWTWLKNYWYWPVIVILLIFSVGLGASSREKLFDLFSKQKESYDKEIQIIKETSEKAAAKKTEIFAKHKEELKKIEEEYGIKLEEAQEEKRKELVKVIEENEDKPDKLAEEIARILSVEFYKNNR
tara:strand:- start:1833 stop:2237 length:405 start_codon:yes stop_codon:yes gene_type:complete